MLNEVPEGWQIKPLKNVAKVVTGKTPSTKQPQFWGGDIPFITPSDLTGSLYVSEATRKLTKVGAEKSKLIPKHSLIFTCIASIGKASISNVDCVTNQQINSCIFESIEDSLFYHYQLQHRLPELLAVAGKTAVAIINKGKFELFNVLVPSIEERERIAEVLSSVDESIQATQRLIEQAERVKQGLMEELLTGGLGSEAIERGEVPEGWAQENLGSVFSVITKGTTPTSVGYAFESSGVPFIKVENISASGKIINKTSQYISEECHAKLARSVIEKGAILFSIAGTIGKVALYEEDYQSNTNQALAILRGLNEDAASKGFIFQLLKSTYVYDTLQSQRTVGAQPNISLKQLKELVVNLPPLTEQKRIAEVLSSVDDRVKCHKEELEELGRLKKGLMDDLLTGKVRTV